MPPLIDSFILLSIIIVLARYIKRHSSLLQRLFIPSSLIAGVVGLLMGPQILGYISPEVTAYWETFPKYLITIVFAGLFLGKFIPPLKEIWKASGPMIAFGNTLAWGQYVIGIALAIFVLTPFFGAPPIAGALIELSFEGGHGSASGLAPTFEQLGWAEGTDIALGLATMSLIVSIISGVIMINIYNRRYGRVQSRESWEEQQKQMIQSGYDLTSLSRKFDAHPFQIIINVIAFAVSIGIGWLILQGLISMEDTLMKPVTDIRFFTYLPLFTLAMLGGLIVQLTLKKFHRQSLIQRKTAENFSTMALDLLIASAVSTISLKAIGSNIEIFLILGIAGILWIVGSLFFFAPKIFHEHWFINGVTNYGQSMGMTATGLLLNRLVDPTNEVKAKENFAYKQLIFEPFMGGGIVTAMAAIAIHEFGSFPTLIIALWITGFWIWLGWFLYDRHNKNA